MTSDGLKINRNTELHLPCLTPFWASDPSSVNELNPEATMAPGSLPLPPFLCLTFHHPQAGLAPQFERMGELFLLLGNSQSLIVCASGTGYRNILRPHPSPSCLVRMLQHRGNMFSRFPLTQFSVLPRFLLLTCTRSLLCKPPIGSLSLPLTSSTHLSS